jgi:hypothetical protein
MADETAGKLHLVSSGKAIFADLEPINLADVRNYTTRQELALARISGPGAET